MKNNRSQKDLLEGPTIKNHLKILKQNQDNKGIVPRHKVFSISKDEDAASGGLVVLGSRD